jgi:5-methylthioribose kinase
MGTEATPEENENWKSVLLSGRIVQDHFEQFGFLLSAIHRRSAESAAKVRNAFANIEYFESLLLQPYYLYTAEKVSSGGWFSQAVGA